MTSEVDLASEVMALRTGDEAAFAALVERHRHELQVHCYRMVGSFHDAEDLVQETLLLAWRSRESFEGRSSFRRWLYRIATNAALDFLRAANRRPPTGLPLGDRHDASPVDLPWLEPYPDTLLDLAAPTEAGPEPTTVTKETIELAFLAAIQHLPARQRAVLILRDVLGWRATETAEALDLSVAAVNSALQRARPTLRDRLPDRLAWSRSSTAEEEDLLRRYVTAYEAKDAQAVAALLSEEVRMTMPPLPLVWDGRAAVLAQFGDDVLSGGLTGDFLVRPVMVNRQGAAAFWVRRDGDSAYRAYGLGVLAVADGRIVELVGFGPESFELIGLPLTWTDEFSSSPSSGQ